jgi:hypothetical protein
MEWATEYCDISYKLLYKTGTLADTVYKRDKAIPMFEFDPEASAFKGVIKSRQWVGTHTIVVQASVGADGIYGIKESSQIQITIAEPCDSTELLMPENKASTFVQGMTGVQSMRATVGSLDRVWLMYEEIQDSVGSQAPEADEKFKLCGKRKHYITKAGAAIDTELGKQYPNQYDVSRRYLYFLKYPIGNNLYSTTYKDPLYELEIKTNDFTHQGIHDFELHIALEDYPGVQELVLPFTVTIGDCEVTSFEAPSTPSLFYEIADSRRTLNFKFA